MRASTFSILERRIAATRVILSAVAIVSVYIDPTRPALTRWLRLTGGPFAIDTLALAIMAAHLSYGVVMYRAVARRRIASETLGRVATALDVGFAAAIALVTEGATSPAYPFFAFAILAVGCRSGLRATVRATATSVLIYTLVILSSAVPTADSYVMRPAYLALAGILIGYLGQERLRVEARLRTLEAAAEREKVARSLHDGHVQTLAAVNLTLQSCCELLRRGRHDDVLGELTRLQSGVAREHGALRSYIRSLADVEPRAAAARAPEADARVAVNAVLAGPGTLVENALCIMLEGLRNARQHARAACVTMEAAVDGTAVSLAIDDDGVGFPADAALPWSIVSRASDFGGHVRLAADARPGAHLRVEMPLA